MIQWNRALSLDIGTQWHAGALWHAGATNSKPKNLSIGCLNLPLPRHIIILLTTIASCIIKFYFTVFTYVGLINALRTSALLQNFCILNVSWSTACMALFWFADVWLTWTFFRADSWFGTSNTLLIGSKDKTLRLSVWVRYSSLWNLFRMKVSCSHQDRPLDSRISRQSHGHFGRGLVRRDRHGALERRPGTTSPLIV